MKMEDMPLSGPDNTRLEVRYYLCIQVPMHLPNIGFVFGVTLCFCCCRPWPMTSTLSWWKMPVWACVLRCIELLNRAISSWMKRTKRAWRSLVGAVGSGFYSVCLQCVCLLFFLFVCLFFLSRNCGSTRSGHIWAGVQSVEEQRVWVSQL